jgi:malate permease and related proteins
VIFIAAVIAAATAIGVAVERRHGRRADHAATRLMSIIVWVLMPPVAFFNLAALHFTAKIGAGIAYGWAAVLGAMAVGWFVGTKRLGLPKPSAGALMLSGALGNTGYLGLPFIAALLGFDHLPNAIVYDVLVSSLSTVTVGFAVGAAFGTKSSAPRERVKAFFTRNPPLWATAAGLLAPSSVAPQWTLDLSKGIVFLILPLGFFAVGVILAAEAEEDRMRFPPPLTVPVSWALALKLALSPAIVVVLDHVVLDVPDPYLIQPAMATAIAAILIANQYGLDRRLTASAIAWSTTVVVTVGLVASLVPG